MSLALGLDIGTSGIRTAIIDTDGNLISQYQLKHAAQNTNLIDAELWWESTQDCIRKQCLALQELGRSPHEISALAVDGTSGTMLLTDANLRPVTQALMYNSKGFHRESQLINCVAPDLHITQGSTSALARALYLIGEDKENRANHLLHQADFIMAKLSGVGGYSDYNNSLKTGFDPEAETWPDWLSELGINKALLPEVVAPGNAVATISNTVAKKFNLSDDVKVIAGTTDSIAAFLACAEPHPGMAVTSLGTTLVIKVMSKTRIDDPQIGLYSHRLGKGWLAGGASNTGGGILARLFTPDEIETLSSRIDPKVSPGLNYYPLLTSGERFPINDPDLEPCLIPRPENDVEFLHGILESIAKIESDCYYAIQKRGGAFPHTIYTAGGGSSNQIWTAIREKTLGQKLLKANHTEAAVGVAKLALSRA